MKPVRAFLLVCALVSSTLPSASQTAGAGEVDSYVKAEMARECIPGLALGVYRQGQIVKAQGYGLANIELNALVKPETIFESASLAKQFTATAVMMLVQEGSVGLEDSIRKYFPNAPTSWRPIKVRNLLSHTSGLTEFDSPDKTKPGGPINLHADMTEDELVRIIETFPLDFPPGFGWLIDEVNGRKVIVHGGYSVDGLRGARLRRTTTRRVSVWHSHPEPAWVLTKSSLCSELAAWARCIVPVTPSSAATWR